MTYVKILKWAIARNNRVASQKFSWSRTLLGNTNLVYNEVGKKVSKQKTHQHIHVHCGTIHEGQLRNRPTWMSICILIKRSQIYTMNIIQMDNVEPCHLQWNGWNLRIYFLGKQCKTYRHNEYWMLSLLPVD